MTIGRRFASVWTAITVASMAMATAGAGLAQASPSPHDASVCGKGDSLSSGTYPSLTIRHGVCYLPTGVDVTVSGNLNVASGAMLDAISPGGTGMLGSALPGDITVEGNITVDREGALLLGWCTEPGGAATQGYENCDKNQTGASTDLVDGNIVSRGAMAVIIHGVHVMKAIRIERGGGGEGQNACTITPNLFLDDSDPGINGSQSTDYDFSPVPYSDIESTTAADINVTGLRTCWFGALRDVVTGNFVFDNNVQVSNDANEVDDNQVDGNMTCRHNSPEVQQGDSGAAPNTVDGHVHGECRAN